MSGKRKFPWIAVLGLLLAAAGLWGLYSGPDISQYVFLPGAENLADTLAKAEEQGVGIFPALSLHGVAEKASLSAGSRSQGEITLYEVAGSYAEVYPRRFLTGRPVTRGDAGRRVIVLDEKLAFVLFGDQDPLGQTVTLGETKLEVIGVAASRRSLGETGSFAAWIPMEAPGAPGASILVFSAAGTMGDAEKTLFENTAQEHFGAGQTIILGKERGRATVLLRMVIWMLIIRLLAEWVRWNKRRTARSVQTLRQEVRTRYPRQMLGMMVGHGAGIALIWAALIAAGAGLAVWIGQMMMAFPEWVPEVLTDPASILQRFRELTSAAAAPVQLRTPELAEIRFWGGLVRWGTVLTLLGCILWRVGARRNAPPADVENAGPQGKAE